MAKAGTKSGKGTEAKPAKGVREEVALSAALSIKVADDLYFELAKISDLREQDTNARMMVSGTLTRLAENIGNRGALESVPYCVQNKDGPTEIVSGHHRIRAARTAGMTHVPILVDRSGLSRSAIVSKQLAHNFLTGYDEPDLLKRLIDQMTSVDDLLASGANEEMLPVPEEFKTALFLPRADYKWKFVCFTFLPHQMDKLDELIREIKGNDVFVLGTEDQFEPFIEAVAAYAHEKEIIAVGTAVSMIIDTALEEVRKLRIENEELKNKETDNG